MRTYFVLRLQVSHQRPIALSCFPNKDPRPRVYDFSAYLPHCKTHPQTPHCKTRVRARVPVPVVSATGTDMKQVGYGFEKKNSSTRARCTRLPSVSVPVLPAARRGCTRPVPAGKSLIPTTSLKGHKDQKYEKQKST
jgi:hypothetical protein